MIHDKRLIYPRNTLKDAKNVFIIININYFSEFRVFRGHMLVITGFVVLYGDGRKISDSNLKL